MILPFNSTGATQVDDNGAAPSARVDSSATDGATRLLSASRSLETTCSALPAGAEPAPESYLARKRAKSMRARSPVRRVGRVDNRAVKVVLAAELDHASLLATIRSAESADNYEVFNTHCNRRGLTLTSLTIAELAAIQRSLQCTGAAGAYQITTRTLASAAAGAKLRSTDLFSRANQDKMGAFLLRQRLAAAPRIVRTATGHTVVYGGHTVIGKINAIAHEWAAIPVFDETGPLGSAYGGHNVARISAGRELLAIMERRATSADLAQLSVVEQRVFGSAV